MGLFTLGTDLGMTPIGHHVGSAITKSKSIFLIVLVCFLVGTIITVSEPDLQVLAEQVPNVPNMVLILAVAVGVGIFLVISLCVSFLKIKLAYLLIGFYLIVFILAQFVPLDFLAVAFDSGGVTTGPMTVCLLSWRWVSALLPSEVTKMRPMTVSVLLHSALSDLLLQS